MPTPTAERPPAAPAGGLPNSPSPATFKGVDITNALKIARPSMGDNAGVALYRLLRLVALEDIIGRGAAGTAYVAGKQLGISLRMTKLEGFLALRASLKAGTSH